MRKSNVPSSSSIRLSLFHSRVSFHSHPLLSLSLTISLSHSGSFDSLRRRRPLVPRLVPFSLSHREVEASLWKQATTTINISTVISREVGRLWWYMAFLTVIIITKSVKHGEAGRQADRNRLENSNFRQATLTKWKIFEREETTWQSARMKKTIRTYNLPSNYLLRL